LLPTFQSPLFPTHETVAPCKGPSKVIHTADQPKIRRFGAPAQPADFSRNAGLGLWIDGMRSRESGLIGNWLSRPAQSAQFISPRQANK
jgi:hypothetical protein